MEFTNRKLDLTSLPLSIGSVVRVPFDVEESETKFGDYRIFLLGTLVQIDENQNISLIEFRHSNLGVNKYEVTHHHLSLVSRCKLPENTPFFHRETKEKGIILFFDKLVNNHLFYYVQINNSILKLSESQICFDSHYQDPDPISQLKRYELHHPVWREKRNNLLNIYRELQNTTYGIEDLIGARVHLLNHQAEVIAEVLSNSICRYVLADEVGLGKTIEACVILKALKKREQVVSLIIAPQTLIHQWYNELNNKFWLEFNVISEGKKNKLIYNKDTIISFEILEKHPELIQKIKLYSWELLVVDEVHRLYSNPKLYDELLTLSEISDHVLLLSATPIQFQKEEYLALLKLLDPEHYSEFNEDIFSKMLQAQQKIREVVAYLVKDLTQDLFDPVEFKEEINTILNDLKHDEILLQMIDNVQSKQDLDRAKDVIAYITSNYKLENRIIRNRRKTLLERQQVILPKRKFSQSFTYIPAKNEQLIYEYLHNYVGICSGKNEYFPMLQILFQSASSSPAALLKVLELRMEKNCKDLISASHYQVLKAFDVPMLPEEEKLCNDLYQATIFWQNETNQTLKQISSHDIPKESQHRLVQVLRTINDQINSGIKKILIFSTWHGTLKYLYEILKKRYGSYSLARFLIGMSSDELQVQVDNYQSNSECRILLSDESGGEGRNLQIAQSIIHIDLPWTPAKIEQRIGRVDRIGRAGTVLSILPYALGTIEADLISIWQDAFELFSQSMSGMEIVLDYVQDEVINAFLSDSRDGIHDLRENMLSKAKELKRMVEEERYYEENSGNVEWSRHLNTLLRQYNEKESLKDPIIEWGDLVGIKHNLDSRTKLTSVGKDDFNKISIRNARFVNPPNMEEALKRSGRSNNQKLIGTFDRTIAVDREDVIFLAPGEPWINSLLENAILADRGKCCGIKRFSNYIEYDWDGFEYFFSCRVNPIPFFENGLLPVNIFKAGEFFTLPATCSVLVSIDGQIMKADSPERKTIYSGFSNLDIHYGKRSGYPSPIQFLKNQYPPKVWFEIIEKSYDAAIHYVIEQNDEICLEDSDDARNKLDFRLRGQLASIIWLPEEKRNMLEQQYQNSMKISNSIINGIRKTIWNLESVCFWSLKRKV